MEEFRQITFVVDGTVGSISDVSALPVPPYARCIVLARTAEREQLGLRVTEFVPRDGEHGAEHAFPEIDKGMQRGPVTFISAADEVRRAVVANYPDDVASGKLRVRNLSPHSQRQVTGTTFAATSPPEWPLKAITENHAVEAVKDVLTSVGAFDSNSAMKLALLRTKLAELQPDHFDTRNAPETRVPGFMRRLVIAAEKAGVVRYSFANGGRDLVWLAAQQRMPAQVPPVPPVHRGESRNPELIAIACSSRPLPERLKMLYTKGQMGPFTSIRTQMIQFIVESFGDSKPISVAAMMKTVVQRVRVEVPMESIRGKKISLPIDNGIRPFLLHALSAEPVFTAADGGGLVSAAFPSVVVTGVVADLDQRVDQTLVWYWFRHGGAIRLNDVADFARFLFTGPSSAREDRVHAIFERLGRDGRLVFSDQMYRSSSFDGGNVVEFQPKVAAR